MWSKKYCYNILFQAIERICTLAIEVDEKGDKDRDELKKFEKQKAIEKELDTKFVRINPDEKDFNMEIEIGKVYNHIKRLSKKSLVGKISKRLSELKF